MKPSPIYKFLTILGILVILSYVLVLFIFGGLDEILDLDLHARHHLQERECL